MMGTNHALTGAAAWLAVTASAPVLTSGLMPQSTVGVIAGAVVCAGAALLPDADHHNGTIAHSVPVVGQIVTSAIGQAAGGHRQGLHSLLATIGVLFGSVALGFATITVEYFGSLALGPGLAAMALIAFAAKALKLTKGSWVLPWILGAFVAVGIVLYAPTEVSWLPVAVTLGFVVHLMGDMLTKGGVPLLWPWKPKPPRWWQGAPVLNRMWQHNGYFAVPVLGLTGSALESALGFAVGAYVVAVVGFEILWAFGINVFSIL
jgi:membrane-bound metal-dependent hydrolase YbcI (DUF457 family)